MDPDQTLIWIHTVCLYAKIGLKSLQGYSADDIKQTTFSDAVFFCALRVNSVLSVKHNNPVECYQYKPEMDLVKDAKCACTNTERLSNEKMH